MGVGNEMAQWILKGNGIVVSQRSARPLRPDENYNNNEVNKRKVLDKLIELRWVHPLTSPCIPPRPKSKNLKNNRMQMKNPG